MDISTKPGKYQRGFLLELIQDRSSGQWGTKPLAGEISSIALGLKGAFVGSVFDMSTQSILLNSLNNSGTSQTMPSILRQNGTTYYRNSSGLLNLTPQVTSGSNSGYYTNSMPADTHSACGALCR
jgi:hypothetical protein